MYNKQNSNNKKDKGEGRQHWSVYALNGKPAYENFQKQKEDFYKMIEERKKQPSEKNSIPDIEKDINKKIEQELDDVIKKSLDEIFKDFNKKK